MRDADLAPPPSALDHAQRRLDGALEGLEARLKAARTARPAAAPVVDVEAERERRRLEGELLGARTRERQLEQVAAEASAALGRAAAEVRAALAAEA